MKKTATPTPSSHDPRPYLFSKDEVDIINLGEFLGEDFTSGGFNEAHFLEQLTREQKVDYKQARKEGFHPVLVVDLDACVLALEMRKHS